MDILTLLIVGLVAGVLAAVAVGGVGFGLVGDIAIGIAGSFLGFWIFRAIGWHMPFGGLAGVIAVAFVGSVVLLLIIHVIQRSRL